MKKRLKRPWQRRPRLSRRWKIIRNFLFLIALCLAYWFTQGCPPLTGEQALRRMERRWFLSPGQTMYERHAEGLGSEKLVFVLGDDYAYTGEIERYSFFSRFSLFDIGVYIHDEAAQKDGPVLLALKPPILKPDLDGWGAWETLLFCPWGPENAVRMEVTFSTQYVKRTYPMIYISEQQPAARGELISSERSDWSKTVTASKNEQGFFAVPVVAENDEESRILSVMFTSEFTEGFGDGMNETLVEHTTQEPGYSLNFYDANGVLLQSVTGEIERFY